MNYIYDILLNFQKEYYEFYEWNENDEIYHMRKIPIIKINDKQYCDIKFNTVKFNRNCLKYFSNKAERFKQNNVIKIKYIAIFTNGKETIALKLNSDGVITHKSSLLIEEEDDVIEILKFSDEINLEYQILKENIKEKFKTRFECDNEKLIIDEINKVYRNKDIDKLSYICLECFNKSETNLERAYNKLINEIYKTNNNFHKIYNIFRLSKKESR